jgi:hypothetical protein
MEMLYIDNPVPYAIGISPTIYFNSTQQTLPQYHPKTAPTSSAAAALAQHCATATAIVTFGPKTAHKTHCSE